MEYLLIQSKRLIILEKEGLIDMFNDFSVDYFSINVNGTSYFNKYLMKEYNIKCLDLLKKCLLDY